MICLLTYVQKECTYYLFNNGELVSQYVKEYDICATTTAMYKWPKNLDTSLVVASLQHHGQPWWRFTAAVAAGCWVEPTRDDDKSCQSGDHNPPPEPLMGGIEQLLGSDSGTSEGP